MTDSRFRRRLIWIICDRTEPAGTALALVDMLCAKRPHTVDKWMRTCPVLVAELRAVATEQHDLSHDNIDRLGPSRSLEHLRQELEPVLTRNTTRSNTSLPQYGADLAEATAERLRGVPTVTIGRSSGSHKPQNACG
jgi:hypothetical protein